MEDTDDSSLVLADDNSSDDGSNYTEWYLDEEILNRLKQNDPSIEKLDIRFNTDDEDEFDANDIDWEEEGISAISKNTHIKSLSIEMWPSGAVDANASEENVKLFLQAVSNNRSIRHFTVNGDDVDSGDMMELLSPCFQHNDVLSFQVNYFHLTSRSVSLMGNALSKGRSLRKFKLENIDGNGDDQDAATAFAAAVIKTKSLQSLDMRFVKSNNWRSLLTPLLNSTDSVLEKLVLRNSNIDDEGLTGLVGALGNNSSLRELRIGENESITKAGWVSLFGYLGNPISLLEHVDLTGQRSYVIGATYIITDDLAYALARAICTNTKLKRLNLTNNYSIKPAGWRTFFNTLRNCNLH